MRRSLVALLLSLAACLVVSGSAFSTGPGGWNHIGAIGPGLNGQVSAMHRFGTVLYLGGNFTNAGGIAAADRIVKWDGVSWHGLGTTPLGNGSVFAIANYGGKIYAGGTFVNAGGKAAADYLAVFDGVSWKPFCNSTPDPAFNSPGLQVRALQVIGTTLYVGGTFQNANADKRADYLIACDLATGTPRPTVDTDGDFTGAVYTLAATSDGTLYAGGTFTNLDRLTTADGVAAYTPDGGWQGLSPTPIGGIVRSLHANGNDLYIGTDGLNVGGIAQADHIVKWDGSAYTALGGNTAGTNGWFPSTAYINAMTSSGSLLFAAGSWQNANGQPVADVVAYFDGSDWRPLGSNGHGNGPWVGDTQALAVVNGQLYAGGALTGAGGDKQANFATSRSLKLPDAEIGIFSGSYVGNDIYNNTGAGQTKTMSIKRGTSNFFPVLVRNEGPLPATFKLKGTGAAPGYSVTYINYQDGANITAAVRNGTFSTGNLARGQTFSLKMIVKLAATAAKTATFAVTATSTAGTPPDVVKGIVRAT
jgi:hypothetical protein